MAGWGVQLEGYGARWRNHVRDAIEVQIVPSDFVMQTYTPTMLLEHPEHWHRLERDGRMVGRSRAGPKLGTRTGPTRDLQSRPSPTEFNFSGIPAANWHNRDPDKGMRFRKASATRCPSSLFRNNHGLM